MGNVRTDSRDYDVISVGSGHHGLIAAAYLAKAGKRVLVLERHDYIGGGCVTKELAPGFRYDETLDRASGHPLQPAAEGR